MAREDIQLYGMKENNLKNIDLTLPKNKLIVFTGLSGSGKSSIVYDTLARESQRQWTSAYPAYVRNQMPLYEKPDVDRVENLTPVMVVDQKQLTGGNHSTVATITDVGPLVRLLFSRIGFPSAGEAAIYRRNHPEGKCAYCGGSGVLKELDLDAMFDKEKSLNEGAITFEPFSPTSWQGAIYYLGSGLFDNNKKLIDYSEREWELLLDGPEEQYVFEYYFKNKGGSHNEKYEGVIPRFKRLYMNKDISSQKQSLQDEVASKIKQTTCSHCEGTGFSQAVLQSKINGKNIIDYYQMQIGDLIREIEQITDGGMGQALAEQILAILYRIHQMNLAYLTLNRATDTLSGGESQRIKIVRSLGSSLNNLTYIFDEPSVSMHPKDITELGNFLLELRDRQNTVIVVEHNPAIIELADLIIDIGPKAGSDGGEVLFKGELDKLLEQESLTSQTLNESKTIKEDTRSYKDSFTIENASKNNLKNISVQIPKEIMTVVTGVAGSGKSTLIDDVFTDKYPDTILVDQKSIGTSSRSTPATYTGVMDIIRKEFAKENDVKAGLFSFNSDGACPVCKGKGEITPDVAYANPVTVVCEVCGGTRYSKDAQSYEYKGRNIVEVLAMSVSEALDFFQDVQSVQNRLSNLEEVGLGYLSLGQSTATLSGGESQRLKLASYLHEKGNTYIFDEPTAGLHPHDVKALLNIFNQIVDAGNTVIIIEHNMEVISKADWIIDLGPEAGYEGGNIIFEGRPKDMVNYDGDSHTKEYLQKFID